MSSLLFAKRLFPLLMMLGLLSAFVLAQTSGSLSGTVQDAQGGVVAGAKVIVSDVTRNFQLDAITSNEGTFTFTTLQP